MKEDIVRKVYTEFFEEDKRLCGTNASSIEYITNKKYILEALNEGDRVLELGAATGRYTMMLAELGYDVTALEYVKENLDVLESKIKPGMNVTPLVGDASDLSRFEDNSFDVVLNMGPLYHFPDHEDRVKVVKESMRVLKKGGKALFAFISNDMVFVTEALNYNPKFLTDEDINYNKESHKVRDYPFTVLTVDSIRELMDECGCVEEKMIASDGYAELLENQINELDEERFKKWMNFHLYMCEKEESLGASHHLLYITEK